jgi:hypothetical protein
MTVFVAEGHAHVQTLVSVVTMATVFEEYTIEVQRCLCVFFLWAKGLNAKDIHMEMLPIYDGKCLSRKAVHNLVEKRDKRFADDEKVETEVRKWLRQQSKDFCVAGFDALVKRWDTCINVDGGYVDK